MCLICVCCLSAHVACVFCVSDVLVACLCLSLTKGFVLDSIENMIWRLESWVKEHRLLFREPRIDFQHPSGVHTVTSAQGIWWPIPTHTHKIIFSKKNENMIWERNGEYFLLVTLAEFLKGRSYCTEPNWLKIEPKTTNRVSHPISTWCFQHWYLFCLRLLSTCWMLSAKDHNTPMHTKIIMDQGCEEYIILKLCIQLRI